MKELISVIIPTHNRSQLLLRTINSIQNQTYSNLEILICDDGSTDDTKQVVESLAKSDSRIKYFYCGPAHGFPAFARNLGIENAIGTYLAFDDDDDCWLPAKLESQLYYMKHYKLKACCTNAYKTDYQKKYDAYFDFQKDGIYTFKDFYSVNPVICSSMIVRKSILKKNGIIFPLEDIYRAIEDYACWFCISSKYKIGYLNTPSVLYFDQNGTSIRKTSDTFESQQNRVVRNFLNWKKAKGLFQVFLGTLMLWYSRKYSEGFFHFRNSLYNFLRRAYRFIKVRLSCKQ